MKHKYWLIFFIVQLLGVLGGAEAIFLQDAIFWLCTIVILLPGSLVFFLSYKFILTEPRLFLWGGYASAVALNGMVFALMIFLSARKRKLN